MKTLEINKKYKHNDIFSVQAAWRRYYCYLRLLIGIRHGAILIATVIFDYCSLVHSRSNYAYSSHIWSRDQSVRLCSTYWSIKPRKDHVTKIKTDLITLTSIIYCALHNESRCVCKIIQPRRKVCHMPMASEIIFIIVF